MKRFLTFLVILSGFFAANMFADDPIENITLNIIKNGSTGNGNPRTPILVPTASLDGHTFYINGGHADFLVQLLDEDDNVVYQTVMPSDVSSIVLPSTLSGDYQIQLLWGDWMLYGWINL